MVDEEALLASLEGYKKKADRMEFRRGYREVRKLNIKDVAEWTNEFKGLKASNGPYVIGRALGLAANILGKGVVNPALELYRKAGFITSDIVIAKLKRKIEEAKDPGTIRSLAEEIRNVLEERKGKLAEREK